MRKVLYDVVIIRLLLIILLVVCHSFAIYHGTWPMPVGIHDVETYYWIAAFSYSFLLETFVFISGYVFGYQIRQKYQYKLDFGVFVLKKAKRLLIPSIIFSILYSLCFNFNEEIDWGTYIYNIINGEGHMWFLPMLFWCFVAIYIVEKIKLPSKFVMPVAFLASMLSLFPLPLRLSSAAYYFLFFYIGYILQRDNININFVLKSKTIVILFLCYVLCFVSFKYLFNSTLLVNIDGISVVKRLGKILYSSLGLFTVFGFVNRLINSYNIILSKRLIKLSGCCFGVYIFQQFILKYIIYDSFFIDCFGTYILPWVAFFIALFCSILLTLILLKTKVGRFLIG